jgi:hypothetical protein
VLFCNASLSGRCPAVLCKAVHFHSVPRIKELHVSPKRRLFRNLYSWCSQPRPAYGQPPIESHNSTPNSSSTPTAVSFRPRPSLWATAHLGFARTSVVNPPPRQLGLQCTPAASSSTHGYTGDIPQACVSRRGLWYSPNHVWVSSTRHQSRQQEQELGGRWMHIASVHTCSHSSRTCVAHVGLGSCLQQPTYN